MTFDEFRGVKNGRRVIATYYSIQPKSMTVVGERAVKVTYIVPNADANSHIATWALHNLDGRWLLQGFHDYLGDPASYKPGLIVGEDADTALRDLVGMSVAADPSWAAEQAVGTPSPALPAPVAPPAVFHGYDCTVDCSGHEAGYDWAEEHDITDRDDCPIDPSNSHSFTEVVGLMPTSRVAILGMTIHSFRNAIWLEHKNPAHSFVSNRVLNRAKPLPLPETTRQEPQNGSDLPPHNPITCRNAVATRMAS